MVSDIPAGDGKIGNLFFNVQLATRPTGRRKTKGEKRQAAKRGRGGGGWSQYNDSRKDRPSSLFPVSWEDAVTLPLVEQRTDCKYNFKGLAQAKGQIDLFSRVLHQFQNTSVPLIYSTLYKVSIRFLRRSTQNENSSSYYVQKITIISLI